MIILVKYADQLGRDYISTRDRCVPKEGILCGYLINKANAKMIILGGLWKEIRTWLYQGAATIKKGGVVKTQENLLPLLMT